MNISLIPPSAVTLAQLSQEEQRPPPISALRRSSRIPSKSNLLAHNVKCRVEATDS